VTAYSANAKALHPRNIHRYGYDFSLLTKAEPSLAGFIKKTPHGQLSIDYADPEAVFALNKGLLKQYYGIQHWSLPEGALCPPIPGRVDYIHYVAELLNIPAPEENNAQQALPIRMLDIGIGSNGIYSLLASALYGWQCVGSDISQDAIDHLSRFLKKNSKLANQITLRKQPNKHHIFEGTIQADELFDISVCNPPFHDSAESALKSHQQKINKLSKSKPDTVSQPNPSRLNFGGVDAELWCKGGEALFIKKMIKESQLFSHQCRWFTTLISKAENVKPALKQIRKAGAHAIHEIPMQQGNKQTRVIAWTYQTSL